MIADGFFQWALALLPVVSLPFSGQLTGYLGYRLLRRQQDFVAHFVGAVVPPLGFFYHLRWLAAPGGLSEEETIAAAAGVSIQLIFGVTIQLALHNRHKFTGEDVHNLR